MGLPCNARDLRINHNNTPQEHHAAATYIANRLGDTCRPILEALGLIGYIGHDIRAGRRVRVWRAGTRNEL